jgi:hypothetical protein
MVPCSDPERIYIAGNGTAGTLALLCAAHEPRVKGCIAYAPVTDVEAYVGEFIDELPPKKFRGLAEFELELRLTKHLRKQIYLEKALERFQQWLLSVMTDARCDLNALQQIRDAPPQLVAARLAYNIYSSNTLNLANRILRQVLGDQGSHFVWLGRHDPDKLGVAVHGQLKLATLGGLSAGQSTLLGIFGTILRYGDHGKWGGHLPPAGGRRLRGARRRLPPARKGPGLAFCLPGSNRARNAVARGVRGHVRLDGRVVLCRVRRVPADALAFGRGAQSLHRSGRGCADARPAAGRAARHCLARPPTSGLTSSV